MPDAHAITDVTATTGSPAGIIAHPRLEALHFELPESAPLSPPPSAPRLIQPRFFDKIEAFISKLSMRDNFWNGVCSLLWLPLAFFSGIRMKELDANSMLARAVLPFRRFNRNWYRAMAGGALLAN